MTLDEIVATIRKRRIAGSRSAVWRFFARRAVSFKKTLYAVEQKRADVVRARRRWVRVDAHKNFHTSFEAHVSHLRARVST